MISYDGVVVDWVLKDGGWFCNLSGAKVRAMDYPMSQTVRFLWLCLTSVRL